MLTIFIQACIYARHLCVQAGVKFTLGDQQGKVENLIVEKVGRQKKVVGVKTSDEKQHRGDLVIVAGK
jgi:sarcosine oxidase / L-pipecolate oxidase